MSGGAEIKIKPNKIFKSLTKPIANLKYNSGYDLGTKGLSYSATLNKQGSSQLSSQPQGSTPWGREFVEKYNPELLSVYNASQGKKSTQKPSMQNSQGQSTIMREQKFAYKEPISMVEAWTYTSQN